MRLLSLLFAIALAAQDTWVAYNPLLEREILPQTEDVEAAITKLLDR